MYSILSIAIKDLLENLRNRTTFLFLLIMPVVFTVAFGYVFSGASGQGEDDRLPVGYLNLDHASPLSQELQQVLSASGVIRLEVGEDPASLEEAVAGQELAAAVIVPEGYDRALRNGSPLKLKVLADPASAVGASIQAELSTAAGRVSSAARAAQGIAPQGGAAFEAALQTALAAWRNPPVQVAVTRAGTAPDAAAENRFAHSSPGMALQFAVAGLLTSAQVIVSERKNHCLKRLLTTGASRWQVLLGHYLSIALLLLVQFAILILFGQLLLGLDYLGRPLATLLVTLGSVLCIAALGLLIGAAAKAEEQAIAVAMIAMFLLSGLGGAWVPLEQTGEAFQAIGHLTPLAWAMDGYKDILLRGAGAAEVLLPTAALLGYALLFLFAARWRFSPE